MGSQKHQEDLNHVLEGIFKLLDKDLESKPNVDGLQVTAQALDQVAARTMDQTTKLMNLDRQHAASEAASLARRDFTHSSASQAASVPNSFENSLTLQPNYYGQNSQRAQDFDSFLPQMPVEASVNYSAATPAMYSAPPQYVGLPTSSALYYPPGSLHAAAPEYNPYASKQPGFPEKSPVRYSVNGGMGVGSQHPSPGQVYTNANLGDAVNLYPNAGSPAVALLPIANVNMVRPELVNASAAGRGVIAENFQQFGSVFSAPNVAYDNSSVAPNQGQNGNAVYSRMTNYNIGQSITTQAPYLNLVDPSQAHATSFMSGSSENGALNQDAGFYARTSNPRAEGGRVGRNFVAGGQGATSGEPHTNLYRARGNDAELPTGGAIGVPNYEAIKGHAEHNDSISSQVGSVENVSNSGYGSKNNFCNFCKNAEITNYRDHATKDQSGRVICPILFRHVCENCGATGPEAHTKAHCPENGADSWSVVRAVKQTPVKSNGKPRKSR